MKIYHNLTQSQGERLVYFRSTDIEQKNYHRLLWSVPDEWLYLFHEGIAVWVIDKSTKKRGKVERIFAPVLNDFLNLLYFGKPIQNKIYKHHIYIAQKALQDDPQLERKFLFWRGKIKAVIIKGITKQVHREKGIEK